MTTATLTRDAARQAGGHYGFRDVARMEWLKLRSVRSTWWTLLVFTAAMIGLAIPILVTRTGPPCRPRTGPPSTRPTTASPGWPSASSPSASSACW